MVLGQAQPYGLAAVVELVNHELSQGFDRYGLPPPLRVEALLQAEKTVEREAYAARRHCLCIGYALQRQNKRFFPIKRQTAVQAPSAAQRIAAQISLPLKGQRGQQHRVFPAAYADPMASQDVRRIDVIKVSLRRGSTGAAAKQKSVSSSAGVSAVSRSQTL